MSLNQSIANWNRKSIAQILAIYVAHCAEDAVFDSLIGLLKSKEHQSGATWLLKYHWEKGKIEFEDKHSVAIFPAALDFEHWDARLHILQVMEGLPIPLSQIAVVEKFLRTGLRSDNKFERAWSYSGFHRLAELHSEFRIETLELLNRALNEESAGSVLSRVRRCLKAQI